MTATLPAGVRTTGTPTCPADDGQRSGPRRPSFARADLISRMRDIFGAATRNNTSIFTLDPRGLATS